MASAQSRVTWEESKTLCENNGSELVSMENVSAELNFLNKTTQAIEPQSEYYIGLKKDNGTWRWISNNSTVETPKQKGEYPWAAGQPKDDNCAKIFFDSKENYLVYDDIKCDIETTKVGYICERQLVECNKKNGMYQGTIDFVYLFLYCR